MSSAFREDAYMETAISTTRLPKPSAATSHVFSRIYPPGRIGLLSLRQAARHRHPVNRGAPARHALPSAGRCAWLPPENAPISTLDWMEDRDPPVFTRAWSAQQLSEAKMFLPTPAITPEWSRVIVVANRAPFRH